MDPVKAAETPVPRASPAVRKRQSEESLSSEGKKVKIASAIPPQAGVLGVLRPANYKKQSPIHSEWSSASPTSDQYIQTPLEGSTPTSHASLPIDPSLTSAYPDPALDSIHDIHYSYSAPVRPGMISLPSLEEIATEVLDMDGGDGPNAIETGLAAIQQFNRSGSDDRIMPADSVLASDEKLAVRFDDSTQNQLIDEQSTADSFKVEAAAKEGAERTTQAGGLVSEGLPLKPLETMSSSLDNAQTPPTPCSTTKRKDEHALTLSPSVSKTRHTRATSRSSAMAGDEIIVASHVKEDSSPRKK